MSLKSPPEALSPDREEWVGDYEVEHADLEKHADNDDEARSQIKKLEKDGPPQNLADWPKGKAMFLTFGGAEGDSVTQTGRPTSWGLLRFDTTRTEPSKSAARRLMSPGTTAGSR